jgi:hypothetical protein
MVAISFSLNTFISLMRCPAPKGVTSATQKAIDDNLGRQLPLPGTAMTRAEAAVFVCQQMGWPIC